MLTSLLGIEQQNQAMLKSIQKSVIELVKVQKGSEKAEAKRANAAANEARRNQSDKGKKAPGAALRQTTEEKKKEKGFFGRLMDSLTGGLTGIMALPLVIKAGGVLLAGALGLALTNKDVRKALFEALKYAFDMVMGTIGKTINHGWHSLGSFFTGGGMTPGAKDARRAKADTKSKEERAELDQLIKLINKKESKEREYFRAATRYEKLKAKGKDTTKAKEALDLKKEEVGLLVEEIEGYTDLAQAKNINIEQDLRLRTIDEMKFGILTGRGVDEDLLMEVGGYRKGGPIRVPGRGTGDTVPAILPPGSFVMNRNATGYQMGGIPVMLEPGEDVYAPGQWGAPEVLLNSLMPRFQRGGEVDAKKPKNPDADAKTQGAKVAKPENVTPGGRLEFIGDGSGISGALNMYDGANKLVASVGAISGQNRTAQASQEQRMQIAGEAMPLPDGEFNLSGYERHPGRTNLGDWSAYIGGPSGNIGNRSGIMLHTDLGHDGTIGCIGTETGPGRGTKKDRQFQTMYEKVQPRNVKVDLTGRSDGKVSNVEGGDDGRDPKDMPGGGNPIQSFFGESVMAIAKGLGLPGLGQYFNVLGEVISEVFGEAASYIFGGGMMNNIMSPAKADETTNQPSGDSPGGMSTTDQQGAMNVVGGMGFGQKEWDIYRNTLAKIESGGKYNIAGGSGDHYDGRYQMGAAAKTDAARILGVNDPGHTPGARARFRQNAEMQEEFFAAFTKANYNYLMGNPKFANAKPGRKLEILGYAHNQGMGGAENWLNTGQVGSDGFGTKGTAYSEALKTNLKAAGFQQGGYVNLAGKPAAHMRRFAEAQDLFESMAGAGQQPIVIMAGGGGGGGVNTEVMAVDGAPPPPNLPSGPDVVALLELQNRLALGAMI